MTGTRALIAALLIAVSPAAARPAPGGPRAAPVRPGAPAARGATPPLPPAGVTFRPAPPKSGPLTLATKDVLVALGDGSALRVGAGARAEIIEPALAATFDRLGIDRVEDVGHAGPAASGRGPASTARFLKLSSRDPAFDAVDAARTLRATGRFRAVCPNYRLQLFATNPNDTYLADQWYVHDPAGGDVHLPEAWDLEKGGSSVTIGIMDTGVDTGHPDLASKIWVNPGEIPGNGLDDDHDGYVDDVNGWDFGNNDADPNPEPVFDPNEIDVGFHGTFVAGIASAATDNGQGIAGAGWNCRILPLKVTDTAGDITTAAVTPAFFYAAAHHVSVLNMSIGGPGDPGVPEYFQALVDMADSAGVLCVAAAGNDGASTPTYPAGCARVLSVGAMDTGNVRASFSNFGSWVRIAAPGASMWSSICRNYAVDDFSQIIYIYYFGWDGENPYMLGDGTSFACPLTSGACALVRHRAPSLTPEQVAARMIATGDAITFDEPIGPKLNAYRAVSAPLVGVEDAPASVAGFDRVAPNPFRSSTVFAFTTAAPGPVRLRLYDLGGRQVREIVNESLPPGRYTREWSGAGGDGRRVASGVYVAVLETAGVRSRQKLVLLR